MKRWAAAWIAIGMCAWGAQTLVLAQTVAQPQAPLLQQVRAQLQSAPVLRGSFTQSKTLQGFKQPLHSSGVFVVAQGRGIVWQVQQPFASTLRVTPDSLQSVHSSGSVGFALQAQQEPALRTINAMLFAVMGADVQALEQHFHIAGRMQPGQQWHLQLLPREPMLSRWLQKIELQGAQHVQQVRLYEAQGEVSEIRLQNITHSQDLSGDEASLFE